MDAIEGQAQSASSPAGSVSIPASRQVDTPPVFDYSSLPAASSSTAGGLLASNVGVGMSAAAGLPPHRATSLDSHFTQLSGWSPGLSYIPQGQAVLPTPPYSGLPWPILSSNNQVSTPTQVASWPTPSETTPMSENLELPDAPPRHGHEAYQGQGTGLAQGRGYLQHTQSQPNVPLLDSTFYGAPLPTSQYANFPYQHQSPTPYLPFEPKPQPPSTNMSTCQTGEALNTPLMGTSPLSLPHAGMEATYQTTPQLEEKDLSQAAGEYLCVDPWLYLDEGFYSVC